MAGTMPVEAMPARLHAPGVITEKETLYSLQFSSFNSGTWLNALSLVTSTNPAAMQCEAIITSNSDNGWPFAFKSAFNRP